MLDWRSEVRRKLADSKLSAAERDEMSRELAGYLEDLCSDAPACGLDDSAAAQNAAAELYEDKHLGANLFRARKEHAMYLNDRTKRFWLPGMTMLFASASLLTIFELAGLRPHFTTLWLHGGPADPHAIFWPLMIYYPWLCALPFLGAAGAYWSRRAGGSLAVQAAAGFFSVLVFLAILSTVLVVSVVIAGLTGGAPVEITLFPEVAGAVVSWVVIPGAALLLGVLPFLRGSNAANRRIA